MIEVHLFGDLRHYAGNGGRAHSAVVWLPAGDCATVGRVLAELGIDPQEVSHVFLNGRLLPRSAYPISLGYPLTSAVPLSSEGWLGTVVGPGDRVGIFPLKMGLVVV